VCKRVSSLLLVALAACVGDIDAHDVDSIGEIALDAPPPPRLVPDAPAPAPDAGACPADMAPVGEACMDLYEAPNVAGAAPLVMYTFDESEAWCAARGKRLCYDDEWQRACEGPARHAYPYGAARVPGRCNDDKVWRVYTQSLLSAWPAAASATGVGSLAELLAAARGKGAAAAASADHVEALYQGEGAGAYPGCVGPAGVFDLVGSVEEWTRRRDGGQVHFHGNLKGRYWAEPRTCQSGVKTHGDAFRFYEIGFRCCRD
jgi:sulfatase modifying factor 1